MFGDRIVHFLCLAVRNVFHKAPFGIVYSRNSNGTLRDTMKTNLFLVVATTVLIGCAQTYAAQETKKDSSTPLPKVSPELWKRTQEKGMVRVIASLMYLDGQASRPVKKLSLPSN